MNNQLSGKCFCGAVSYQVEDSFKSLLTRAGLGHFNKKVASSRYVNYMYITHFGYAESNQLNEVKYV